VFICVNLPGGQDIGMHMHPADYTESDDLTVFEGVYDKMLEEVHATLFYGIRDYLESL
jgi:hypothetical protein